MHTYTSTVEHRVRAKGFIDGVLESLDTHGNGTALLAPDFLLGTREDLSVDRFLGGSLDSVRICDRSITSIDVAKIHGLSINDVASTVVVTFVNQTQLVD